MESASSNATNRISQSEYARRRGISRQAVNDLIARGILTLSDGQIDPARADQELLQLNPEKSKALQSMAGQGLLELPTEPSELPATESAEVEITSYHVARTLSEKYKAATAKIEYLKLIGTLVSVDDVREHEFEIFRKLRDNLIAIADRLAPRLAAETDPVRVSHLVHEEIRKALYELSRALGVVVADGAGERTPPLQ